jgi:hypothetical protein
LDVSNILQGHILSTAGDALKQYTLPPIFPPSKEAFCGHEQEPGRHFKRCFITILGALNGTK